MQPKQTHDLRALHIRSRHRSHAFYYALRIRLEKNLEKPD
ncbi:Unknown protein sequence [Pseudomonas amygdali pv. lachrymans]|nr:Unknown protein sequence [Pseudomonas amygdali pv. lachrymans]